MFLPAIRFPQLSEHNTGMKIVILMGRFPAGILFSGEVWAASFPSSSLRLPPAVNWITDLSDSSSFSNFLPLVLPCSCNPSVVSKALNTAPKVSIVVLVLLHEYKY